MIKYLHYVLEDQENPEIIQFIFILQVDLENVTPYNENGHYEISWTNVVNMWDYLEEYNTDYFWFGEDDLLDSFEEAQKKIIEDVMKW